MRYSNVFYFHYINKIGGIESWLFYIAKKYKNIDITIFYKSGDEKQIKRLKQYVRVVKYTGLKITCDKFFTCFNMDIIDNVEANEYIYCIHGDYLDMLERKQLSLIDLPYSDKITKIIGVSQLACDSYTKLTGRKADVFYNPIELDKPKKMLNLISATRLTVEKGRERMIAFSKKLNEAGIPYNWLVFTDSTNKINNPNIVYMDPRLDITNYIANADALVQLSDNEGYCYSVVEALTLGRPVIVTDLPVFKELGIKDKENGYVLDFDLKNLDVNEIYKNIFDMKVNYTPKADVWGELLVNKKSTYKEELKMRYKVQALETYKQYDVVDSELKRIPKAGEVFTVTKERLDVLMGDNAGNRVYVKVLEEIKPKAEPKAESKVDVKAEPKAETKTTKSKKK